MTTSMPIGGRARLGYDAFVTALGCAIEFGAVGQPSQGICKFFTLVTGSHELEGKSSLESPNGRTFDGADVVEDRDDAFADVDGDGLQRLDGGAAG
jgi:hypothetical protein